MVEVLPLQTPMGNVIDAVDYADYAALKAENERLKKALSEQVDGDISCIFPGERALAERAGGQQDNEPRAYIVHAPEDDYYGTGPDRLQFHPLAQHDMDNGYRQTPLYGRPAEQPAAWQHIPGCGTDRESKMVSVSEGVFCDPCIAPLVAALNTAGIETVASCCGHGHRPGVIALRDGRELFITKDFDEARQVDAIFPIDINGNTRPSEQAVTDEIVAKVSHGFLKKWGFPIAEHFIRDILKAAMEAGRHG